MAGGPSHLETFDYKEAAEPILVQAQAQEPDNLEIAHALAKNRMQLEKFEEALPIFEAMAAQPDNEYFQERAQRDANIWGTILARSKTMWICKKTTTACTALWMSTR